MLPRAEKPFFWLLQSLLLLVTPVCFAFTTFTVDPAHSELISDLDHMDDTLSQPSDLRHVMRWRKDKVAFWIDSDIPTELTKLLSQKEIEGLFSKALARWNDVPTSRLRLSYSGLSNQSRGFDGANTVKFALQSTAQKKDGGEAFPIAAPRSGRFTKDGHIAKATFPGELLDCDIEIYVADLLSKEGRSRAETLEILGNTLTHEIGHCLGLGHSIASSIMTRLANRKIFGVDDEIGISTLYPNSRFFKERGGISGELIHAGTAFAAEGMLITLLGMPNQNEIASFVTGFHPAQNAKGQPMTFDASSGSFTILGLREGRYRLLVSPIERDGQAVLPDYLEQEHFDPSLEQPNRMQLLGGVFQVRAGKITAAGKLAFWPDTPMLNVFQEVWDASENDWTTRDYLEMRGDDRIVTRLCLDRFWSAFIANDEMRLDIEPLVGDDIPSRGITKDWDLSSFLRGDDPKEEPTNYCVTLTIYGTKAEKAVGPRYILLIGEFPLKNWSVQTIVRTNWLITRSK